MAVVAQIRPRGLYSLQLSTGSEHWSARLPEGGEARAHQASDGSVTVRAPSADGVELARFMLALDDDTREFVRRFRDDALLGPSIRSLPGLRPPRLATVAHATLRAICGQLIEARRARAIERRIIRLTGGGAPTREGLAALAPVALRREGLATPRASTLIRLSRSIDLEGLRAHSTPIVLERLTREPGVGPWSVGVIALEGLGRYDHGLVGDLGLVKLVSSIRRRWVEGWETAEVLAPYGEWQGLACTYLMVGWRRGLVPGANADVARLVRTDARRKRAA
jgi:3-methyladenine DNA glycosylase/8-oxoguanine DNA glycosylase